MRLLETNRSWVVITALLGIVSLMVHLYGQTGGFMHDYFSEPNLYHTWPTSANPRFDEITHPLSSAASTAILLNFNLPLTFAFKWIIAIGLGMIAGLGWEGGEALVAPFFGWIKIARWDTGLDLMQDLLGSASAILLYDKIVRRGVD